MIDVVCIFGFSEDKKRGGFQKTVKKSEKIQERCFFFYFLKNDYPYHRFAVTVKKKIGSAVQRNYIKRKMREYFRLNQHLLQDRQKYDLWVVLKQRFDRDNAGEIEQRFIDSLKRVSPR